MVFKERTSLQHSKLCACCFVLVGQCITDEVIALITTNIIIIGMPISYTFSGIYCYAARKMKTKGLFQYVDWLKMISDKVVQFKTSTIVKFLKFTVELAVVTQKNVGQL